MYQIEKKLPELLHAAYFCGGIVMPHCKSKIILEGGNIEAAKLAFEGSKELGLMRKAYDGKSFKKGCYVVIDDLRELNAYKLEIRVTGISRFVSEKLVSIDHYVHRCITPSYELYEQDFLPIAEFISLKDVEPIFSKYFIMFLSQMNLEENVENLNMFSMDKFINSLIMIMPMRDVERLYLSELPTFKEKEQALSMILQSNETGLTNVSKYN